MLIERIYLQHQVDLEWEDLNAQREPLTSFPLPELEKILRMGLDLSSLSELPETGASEEGSHHSERSTGRHPSKWPVGDQT